MAHSLGWEVLGELRSDGSGVTVGSENSSQNSELFRQFLPADLAPDDSGSVSGGTRSGASGLDLGLVDVGDSKPNLISLSLLQRVTWDGRTPSQIQGTVARISNIIFAMAKVRT